MKFVERLGLLFLLRAVIISAAPAAPVVNLGYAQYQGVPIQDEVTNATHTQFLGMRYAAPPTGSSRFKAPAAPATTPGVQVANAEPSMCFGASSGVAGTTPFRASSALRREKRAADAADAGPSEDCLFVNVYIPGNLGQRKNLPVVFWIHGGGYVAGSATGADGNDLIRLSGEGVVVVIIQYRLGVFGFLPGQKVKDGGALNAGLLDQDFALRWVQQHISKFGGDPSKVTIWGESAGAGSVLQHVIANGGKTNPPLFRAAITSSTFLPSQYIFNGRIPEMLYSETVAQTNCSSAADTLNCLRQVDVNTLQAANTLINDSGFFGTFVFVPVVDGTFITERPTQLLQNKQVNGQILYSVTNTFEGAVFVDTSGPSTAQISDYVSQLFPNFGTTQIQAATAQYAGLGSSAFQAIAMMGESIFICPTYFLLRAFGGLAFKGEFAIPPGNHGDDVAYYFTNGETPPFGNPEFDKAFGESFLDFAMSLNTNVKWDSTNNAPPWPTWDGLNEMLFNETDAGAPDVRTIKTSTALLERCDFWESVGAFSGQ
jgi:carboxylesterase type B